jgi:hypothetical protein
MKVPPFSALLITNYSLLIDLSLAENSGNLIGGMAHRQGDQP